MLIRDLILPFPPDDNGKYTILECGSGNIVHRERFNTDITWEHLSGDSEEWANRDGNHQPYAECATGGDLVMARLMSHLAGREPEGVSSEWLEKIRFAACTRTTVPLTSEIS